MKIKKAEPEFKPINIIITIESEEELRAMIALGSTNHSVPEAVARGQGDNRYATYVVAFCDKLRRAL